MKNFWKNKKVVVSGANGFLGSHLTSSLLRAGARVEGIIKERMPYSYLNGYLKARGTSRCVLTRLDIARTRPVLEFFRNRSADICLHVAAQPIVGLANQSPLPTFEANIRGTWNILEACRLYGIGAVVVASSDKAYGQHRKLPYREDAALRALHPYDASKACTDILTQAYAHTWGVNTAVTRCANIYGPGDLNFSRIVPDTMRAVILNKKPVIRSDGSPVRDYIFIDDVVSAYLLLAETLYAKRVDTGEAFNFGSGNPVTVLELVRTILSIAARDDLVPLIKGTGTLKGEIDRQYLSSLKARRMLGWKPHMTLRRGLHATFVWYKNHMARSV